MKWLLDTPTRPDCGFDYVPNVNVPITIDVAIVEIIQNRIEDGGRRLIYILSLLPYFEAIECCSSLGFGLASSSLIAAITMPGVQ